MISREFSLETHSEATVFFIAHALKPVQTSSAPHLPTLGPDITGKWLYKIDGHQEEEKLIPLFGAGYMQLEASGGPGLLIGC